MTELDQIWSEMLVEAGQRATDSDRHDVAGYLRLKATNDAIRSAGIGWLFDSVIEIAYEAVRQTIGVSIEREEPHSFRHGNSTMVGSLIRVRHGVRCLTVEAGWARTPSDGIMHKGALAYGRISHFGMPKAGGELRFVHAQTLPQWLDEEGRAIDAAILRQHFDKLVGA